MSKWKFQMVDAKNIHPAKVNANRMSDADFNQLVSNIQKSGLSSSITCYKKNDNSFVIISGHHRFRACLKLSYVKIPVIYADEKDLSNDEILAIQMSHNSLHGTDDKGILKKMFEEIKDIDFKNFAHVNIDEIGKISTENYSFSPEILQYTVTVILYSDVYNKLQEILGILDESISKSDLIVVAEDKNENDFLKLMSEVKKKYNIKSTNMSFSKIIELAYSEMSKK